MNIAQKLKDLPSASGVYIMTDADGTIIYIGKAKNLKNRVRSYFSGTKTDKVAAMMTHVTDFRYIITKNETDAFILEANLIKKHKPHYNILLKDDKHYPYIKIDTRERYPKFDIVRKLTKDKSKYFGPYLGISVIELKALIGEIFPLRTCNQNFDKIKSTHRPCLNFDIKQCLAPCAAKATEAEYAKIVQEFINFLNGDITFAKECLTKKMHAATEREDFEEAIYYRNHLKNLEKITYKKVAALKSDISFDVLAYATDGIMSAVSLLIVRNGKIIGGENFSLAATVLEAGEALSAFITQYYQKREVPPEIVTNFDIIDQEAITEWLKTDRSKTVKFCAPQKSVRKSLVDMALVNATHFLEHSKETSIRKLDMTTGAVKRLKVALNLSKLPHRIECFDISNIQGVDKVASMVVFTGGEADRASYRRFKIKTVEGADDFASMNEVVSRRLERLNDEKFGLPPDLIVLDGGKGQLSAATAAAAEQNQLDIDMIALAEKFEHIFVRNTPNPVILDKNSVELKLLIRLRDEAHRFAVTYFRSLHGKNSLASVLDDIKGVGKTLKAALIKHFKSVSKIKEATFDELAKIPKMPKKTAQNIIDHFKGENI